VSTLLQDLRYATRSLARNRGFTAVAVLTLALGVGANTAIFSVLQAIVLRDLPYREPDRLAVMWTWNLQQNLPDGSSYLNFRDWKAQSRAFEQMAAYIRPEFTRATLTGSDSSVRVNAGVVGPDFFEVLGTVPLLGRTFAPDDFKAETTAVIIGHGLWRERFGADPRVVGQTIQVDGRGVEIVGVMPQGFELPTADVQLWQPLFFGPNWQEENSRRADALIVLGRLSSSATMASARGEMNAIAARLRDQYPATNASFGVTTDSLIERVIGPTTERTLWVLFGSVACVLLIACANVANLMLARVVVRHHEFSVRAALGAGKMRMVRQALTENVAVSLLAGAVALLIAWVGILALRSWAAGVLPRASTIELDAGVLLFALASALGCGLLAGLPPALQLATARPANALREGGGSRLLGGRHGRRLNQGLVVAEIALAVMLLCGSGLLIHSFLRVQSANRGFDTQNVLLLQIDLPNTYNSPERVRSFYSDAMARIRALPDVAAAGAISDFFIHRQPDYRIALEGQPPRLPTDPAPPLTEDNVVPGYFEAMRIPLLRGRLLEERDLAPDAPQVVVINEEMARRFWPGDDPIGKRLKYGLDPAANQPWKTVVGVVADMRRQRLDEPAIPYMFQPGVQAQMDIAVRAAGDPASLRDAIRAQLHELDPSAPPYGVVTVEQRLEQTIALRRFQTMLLAALAAVALLLSVIGAYGILQRLVAARTQEIGIRMALGANAAVVLRMVLAAGLWLAVAGLAIGLLGAVALSRLIASFLYETSPLDPLIYASVIVVLLGVTLVAILMPARRAARVDPMVALRDQ
jgi:putative ABC transport system permease protein